MILVGLINLLTNHSINYILNFIFLIIGGGKMKKQAIGLYFVVVSILSSCGPSEEEIRQSVFQTQTAEVTPTFTPSPTETAKPSPTPNPINLRKLILTKEDINNELGGNFYTQEAILYEDHREQTESDAIVKAYIGTGGGKLTNMIVIADGMFCEGNSQITQKQLEPKMVLLDNPFPQIELPKDNYMGKLPDDSIVYVGFSLPGVCVNMELETNGEIAPEDTLGLLSVLMQKQVSLLNDFGYY